MTFLLASLTCLPYQPAMMRNQLAVLLCLGWCMHAAMTSTWLPALPESTWLYHASRQCDVPLQVLIQGNVINTPNAGVNMRFFERGSFQHITMRNNQAACLSCLLQHHMASCHLKSQSTISQSSTMLAQGCSLKKLQSSMKTR